MVELLLVTAIIIIMVSVSISIYGGLQGSSQLNDASDQMILALKTAQERARARLNNNAHGVYFADTAFVLYEGNAYSSQVESVTRTTTLATSLTVTTTIGVSTSTNQNLALNKTAYASSESNLTLNPPMRQQAVDGEISVMWSSAAGQATNSWWQVDLGQVYPLNRARVSWSDSGTTNRCTAWRIQGSNNGVDFTTVWNGNPSTNPQTLSYWFDTAAYRHWRFTCDTAVDTSYALAEVELYAAHGTTRDINFSKGLGVPSTSGTIVVNHSADNGRVVIINDVGTSERQ